MANYHLEVEVISRSKGQSITRLANYISGKRLHDSHYGKTYYRQRLDVLYCKVFQPINAPPEFYDLQRLCDEIERSEKRYDARTARQFKGSLPNELSFSEQLRIVNEYININFVSRGLCAIAAIHEGRNADDPSRNNPHVHIIVSTRTLGPDSFSKKKLRELDQREFITVWREQWADVQNRAYERNHLDIRVSHESLAVQGSHRKPTNHLHFVDWQKEQRGERTAKGDEKRAIEERNREYVQQHQRFLKRRQEMYRSR